MILKCIAIDDEPLALGLVCRFIEQTPFLHLAGRYASAITALETVQSQQIDLIYLDIQMPELNGLELARLINSAPQKPRIILTTAFREFSLDGYKIDALDYLLKPFNYEEFLRSAIKAQSYYEFFNRPPHNKAEAASEVYAEAQYLFLKVEYQLVRIAFDDILYIEGLKDYIKVHLKSREKGLLSLTTLKTLEEKLPARKFMRLHRSFIVALDKISSMTKNSVQVGSRNIVVGDQYREEFKKFTGRWI